MTRPRDMRRARLIETTVLLLAGLLLAVATIYDVALDVRINHRLVADLGTWRAYTGHRYHNLAIDRQLLGTSGSREVVCGNTSAGAPGAKTQLCLVISGPVVYGRRSVRGGWYVPPHHQDVRGNRYGCFGADAQGRCPTMASALVRSG